MLRLLNFALDFLDRRIRKIRHIGGMVAFAFFDHHRVSHSIAYRLSPACSRILFFSPQQATDGKDAR